MPEGVWTTFLQNLALAAIMYITMSSLFLHRSAASMRGPIFKDVIGTKNLTSQQDLNSRNCGSS